MKFWDWLKNRHRDYVYTKMLNGQTAIFSQFGTNIYSSDVVQQALYCIVSEMKKLKPQHVRKNEQDVIPVNDQIQRVLDNPNPLMTTSDFLEKIIWLLYLNYNAFIFPEYEGNRLVGLWPLNPSQVDFLQSPGGELYIRLRFLNGYESTIPYSRMIHIKYRFSVNEFMGGNEEGQPDNEALLKTLSLNDTLLQGVGKALKTSFAINGVVKYNTLLDGAKTEAAIKELENYLKNNESGFLPLDLKGEFIPFQRQIQLVDDKTLEFIDSKILRQFGVPLPILTGDYTTAQLAAFYQKTLEPLIISLGQAFTKVLFSTTELGHGNAIRFYPEELIFMDTNQKLEMVRLLGDSGALYENEKRVAFGLVPLAELSGVRQKSLNYVDVNIANEYQLNGSSTNTQEEQSQEEEQPQEQQQEENTDEEQEF